MIDWIYSWHSKDWVQLKCNRLDLFLALKRLGPFLRLYGLDLLFELSTSFGSFLGGLNRLDLFLESCMVIYCNCSNNRHPGEFIIQSQSSGCHGNDFQRNHSNTQTPYHNAVSSRLRSWTDAGGLESKLVGTTSGGVLSDPISLIEVSDPMLSSAHALCSRHSSLTRTSNRRSSRLFGASFSASIRSCSAAFNCLENTENNWRYYFDDCYLKLHIYTERKRM